VQKNANMFNFNQTFLDQLDKSHKSCGYSDYIEKYLTFPASGLQPPKPYSETVNNTQCDLFDLVFNEAQSPNPCFDVYEITAMCPLQWDVLGFPTALMYEPEGASVYFNRSDVKKALHAPANVDWTICTNENVFVGGNGVGPEGEGDISANPIEHVLPQVIEATNRVLIGNGDYDMIIITNGTLMSIQNMTWNGKLGFESAPNKPIDITLPDLQNAEVLRENGMNATGQGIMGIQHFERGLMWVETYQSGHMQPGYQPRVTYRHIQWLLGHIESL
jgi:carboxypeptidase D